MGRLVEGKWSTEWYVPDEKGRFVRGVTSFRDRVTADGASGFAPEPGRYHLYVSYACPWAHRTLLARALLGLESAISISVVHPFMGEHGWTFDDGPGVIPDPVNHARFLWQIYTAARADFTGRVTVPILWDRRTKTIVNNESREIIRMFGDAWGPQREGACDLCPVALRPDIDRILDAIYTPINNGVYRAGFATTQPAYEEAVTELFAALAHWDKVLGTSRYLLGDTLTEADLCLFTTLLRFDPVYHGHFKCNLRQLRDHDNLWGFVRDIHQLPGVAETCRIDHIQQHYYGSHPTINPTRIVPLGPLLDYTAPHGRERLAARG